MSKKSGVVYSCPYCGSRSVVKDATVRWDDKEQDFVLDSILDGWSCQDCHEDFDTASEEPVEQTSSQYPV